MVKKSERKLLHLEENLERTLKESENVPTTEELDFVRA
jgi:hypothetical protein